MMTMPMNNPKKRQRNVPAVSIVKPVYTMATSDGQNAEITMYGDIYESQPTDWYGEPIEGQFITLNDFLDDLEQIAGCKNITIHMNSYGGDAGVSNTIHNRLRELARSGAAITCIVDGAAMSGGSLIMCACDTVKANPSSVIMIHKCWSFMFGGYNADEMRRAAETNDAWDKMQVEIYKRKTGLSDEEILSMMADTTYMTGREALEKGFVDEIIEDAEPVSIAASADGRTLFVRGHQMHLAPGMFAPDSISTVNTGVSATDETNKTAAATAKEGGIIYMANNLEELRSEYPELTAQLEAEVRASAGSDQTAISAAVQAEQKRIQEIDELASLFDRSMVNEAKYGENACTAQEMTYRAAQRAKGQGLDYLKAMRADNADSGANGVPGANRKFESVGEDQQVKSPEQKMTEARNYVHDLLHEGGE
jgi:ATP-dependent protease ClpP protease subunit